MITLKKFATAIATSALLLQSAAPLALAENTITVSGNGANSDNDVKIEKTNDTVVSQTNVSSVSNNVSGTASTGGNDANYNTGGDVAISTGDAKSSVSVSNQANSNQADVQSCDCDGDTKINISGNGAYSDNYVKLKNSSDTQLFQTNVSSVSNNVDADAKTGGNDANKNTGGDVVILTGKATTDVNVSNAANANVATVGGNSRSGSNDLEAIISGNGAYSDNDIKLYFDRDLTLVQDNYSSVYNWIDADATTGWNDAEYNTGGDVAISTGDARVTVDVDNMANFNAADIDCGCLLGGKFAINGNGYDSDSDIKAKMNDLTSLFQTNVDGTWNDVYADAKTGKNDVNKNTGEADSDPMIVTGDAWQEVNVDNAANMNVIGSGATLELPGDLDLNVDFDVDFLLRLFGFSLHTQQS